MCMLFSALSSGLPAPSLGSVFYGRLLRVPVASLQDFFAIFF